MSAATLTRDHLMPQPLAGRGTGWMFALLAHALLVLALAVGLHWRVSTPVAFEAELWADVPRAAAPKAVEPVEVPPVLAPTKPVARPVETVQPAAPDAKIAVEKARQEKVRQEQARQDKQRLAQAREDKERQRKAAEKASEKAAQAKLDEARRQTQETQRKAQEAQAKTDAARDAQLKRIQGLAGGTGAPTSTGTAAQSAGPSPSYAGRIMARIKPNIVFTETITANPLAEVEIRVAPDGRIVGQKLVQSSGVPAWDDAVQRAIERTETLPRDADGRVPSSMLLAFRPRDR